MPLTNAQLSELLAAASADYTERRQRALRRASRHALMWPVEAAGLADEGAPLTTLNSVGPWVARIIEEILENPPEVPDPDETRQNFLTMSEARAILDDGPEWTQELRADLQMHSTYSDGSRSITEMAMGAMAKGYDYIAITDHSKGLKIAGGFDEVVLAEQMKEIDGVNAEIESQGHDFRILRSIEMNLDTTGAGDMEPDALAKLDVVVGSFHSKLRLKEAQTERALGAARNPDVQIMGHPHGRMYGVRMGVRGDWGRVLEEGAANGKAYEINSQPNRQDLSVPMLELARDVGVPLTIGTDAHSIEELDTVDLSLAAAVKAGIPKEQILNFKPVDEFLGWVATSRETAAAKLR
ncbi:MAG: putative hydrolase [Actinomycetota bacterium]|jgi:histidinol phosphatase-like PHP family hydrolase|nr:putative hydrolase [Actinomycetota bacterium]